MTITTKEEAWLVLDKWKNFSFDSKDEPNHPKLSCEEAELVIEHLSEVGDKLIIEGDTANLLKARFHLKGDVSKWLASAFVVVFSRYEDRVRREGLLQNASMHPSSLINDAGIIYSQGIKYMGGDFFRRSGWLVKITIEGILDLVGSDVRESDKLWIKSLTCNSPGVFTLLGGRAEEFMATAPSASAHQKIINIFKNSNPLEHIRQDILNAHKLVPEYSVNVRKAALSRFIETLGDVVGYDVFHGHENALVQLGCSDIHRKIAYNTALQEMGTSQQAQAKVLSSIFG